MRLRAKGPRGESPGHRPGFTGPPNGEAPTGRNNTMQGHRFRPVGALGFAGWHFLGRCPRLSPFAPLGRNRKFAANVEAAAVMVLHTWNQRLDAHAHVHALVPGGGPSLSGDRRWIKSRRPNVAQCDGNSLVDSEELKSEFRDNFLAGLRRLQASGKLNLNGDWEFLQDKAAFDDWLKPLESVTWVAYIEPPPYENCPPEQVAKYLARYLTGGPISDRRIVSHENGFVTFLARVGKKTGGDDEVEPIRLRGAEFVRRWCLHVLPKGYTKTRRFGGYWNGHRDRYLAESRELLDNALQREFVGHFRAARTSSCCARHSNSSNPRLHFARRRLIESLSATRNHRIRLDRNHRTGHNSGDTLPVTR